MPISYDEYVLHLVIVVVYLTEKRVVRGPVFKFLLGTQQQPMTIHTALVIPCLTCLGQRVHRRSQDWDRYMGRGERGYICALCAVCIYWGLSSGILQYNRSFSGGET